MGKYPLADRSVLGMVITAAFIAIVSFGAIGGVLAATMPKRVFGLVEPVVCGPGESMRYEEWYDGSANQVRIYCADAASNRERERTIGFLGVVLGSIFLAIFWVAWGVLVVIKVVQRFIQRTKR